MLDFLYAQAARTRRRWYERHPEIRRHLKRPVISIGNLTVGGAGKTPLVALVCRWLLGEGERPAVLSRGYGRTIPLDGAVVVSDGASLRADVDRAGDEPFMLAQMLPGARVVVAEDRHVAGALAERKLDATVHVLDDGFQHLSLARDLDVLVTSVGEIPHGRLLPFGRLREPPDAAARADLVVVLGADQAQARSEAWVLGVSQSCGGRRILAAATNREPVFAFAGIADPQQFFAGLTSADWNVVGTMTFPDHHRYSATDVERLGRAVSAAGASVAVTTEKDAVRLQALGSLPLEYRAVPLMIELDPFDTLAACIRTSLTRARTVPLAHVAPVAPFAPGRSA